MRESYLTELTAVDSGNSSGSQSRSSSSLVTFNFNFRQKSTFYGHLLMNESSRHIGSGRVNRMLPSKNPGAKTHHIIIVKDDHTVRTSVDRTLDD